MSHDVEATLSAARALVLARGWRPIWRRAPGVTVDGAVYTAARRDDGTAPTLAPALGALRMTATNGGVWAASDCCGSTAAAVQWIDRAITCTQGGTHVR